MKKTILLFFAIIFLVFSFTSCNQLYDQFIYYLPNNYWLHYYGRQNVCIETESDDEYNPHKILEGKYIVTFFIFGDYVGIKNVVENKDDENWWKRSYKADEENVPYEYYISDTKNEISYGPFSESEFTNECTERGIKEFNWINISPQPKDAIDLSELKKSEKTE